MNFDLEYLKIMCDNEDCDYILPDIDPEKASEFIGKQ